jgi:uncharacterized protein YggE
VRPWLCVAALVFVPVASGATPRTITVNGTGIVSTVPTRADFTFGVSANGATATAALGANSAQMTKVIAALKAHGIAAEDIQTAQISLAPNRNQTGNKILNYTATNSVTARVQVLAKAGPVVDAAVAAGANEVGGPSLTSADQNALSRRALAVAVADARARALAIARAAGVKLGAIRTVSESSSSPVPIAEKAAVSTPIEAGTVEIEADVTVTFAIA